MTRFVLHTTLLVSFSFCTVFATAQTCGLDVSNTETYTVFQPQQTAMRTAGVTCHNIDLAIAVDSAFIEYFGSEQAAAAEVDSILKKMNITYEQANISLRQAELVYFTGDDPYSPLMNGSETDQTDLLDKFSQWAAGGSGFTSVHDLGFLFSGRDFVGAAVVNGYVGAACTAPFKYSIAMWSVSTTFTTNSVGHQLGHNLGAQHDGQGNGCDMTGFVMSGFSSPSSPLLALSSCSQAYFTTFLNSGSAGCIVACQTDGDACTDDYCDKGECYHTPTCSLTIGGRILTELDTPIAGVRVILSGDAIDTVFTGSNGMYGFTVLSGGDYTIAPSKTDDQITNDGVSTLDISLIRRHVLGTQLNSPYRMIAADADSSRMITTLDITFVRKVILDNAVTFPNGRLWEFVPADFDFGSPPYNPFPFPRTKTLTNVTATKQDQDFIGIKLGDANASWKP